MEAVSLESLPPEDSDFTYIPNLSDVQSSTSPSSEQALQSMHLSAIKYTPSASAPAAIPPPLVAAQAPGSLIQGIYRTTFTTQVIAAQTFHYPPTPPIDNHVSERGEKHHLQQTDVENQVIPPMNQNVIENELPVSAGLEKPVNPFPSPLPTPPDVESLHQHDRGAVQSQQHHSPGDMSTPSSKVMSPTFSGPQQQWAAQQAAAANIYFMPPTAATCGAPIVPYSASPSVGARRGCPPVPALQQMYSAAVSNPLAFNDPRCGVSSNSAVMGEMLKKMPPMPALVKEGMCMCVPSVCTQ